MSEYFAYIRVSDQKQERGASLSQQRDDIERYAARKKLRVSRWFQDVETAAKTGRKNFTAMFKLLRKQKVQGVIFHKIDRSSRNRGEWAKLNELFDKGVDVHFAHEGVDMSTRSGRVAADIQAALAVNYIANLRDETIKGMWGRLKQGLLPWSAPPGYRNEGGENPKSIDPVHGPLVRQAFELFSTGRYSMRELTQEMERRGLRWQKSRKSFTKVSEDGIASMLRNPFYIGVIRVKKTGETFPGIHEPLISKALFDRVQQVLDGRTHAKVQKHNFVFRRMIPCPDCGRKLIGEIQKGRYIYYRCHTTGCSVCIPERNIEESVEEKLGELIFSPDEKAYIEAELPRLLKKMGRLKEKSKVSVKGQIGQIEERLMRLTDAYVDGDVEREIYLTRKKKLLLEKRESEERLEELGQGRKKTADRLRIYLELAGSALLSYQSGSVDEKRELLLELTSNWSVDGKNVSVELRFPFQEMSNRMSVLDCCQEPAEPRRVRELPELAWWGRFLRAYLEGQPESG